MLVVLYRILRMLSLSARRAWIEIVWAVEHAYRLVLSLSARRAWIEMQGPDSEHKMISVALRKESVDRNTKFYPAKFV